MHIESKRGFGIFVSTEFLPWDTVEDVFINEVVKGVSTSIVFSVKKKKKRAKDEIKVPIKSISATSALLSYVYRERNDR